MGLTQAMRARLPPGEASEVPIDLAQGDSPLLARLRRVMRRYAIRARGTTQISVADAAGNLASLSLSNGEGSGYLLPGTGVMLNNMLGEEDINPEGVHRWPRDRRLASMMAPSLITLRDGTRIALGSGGSNRIRSAILQVISNRVDFGMPLAEAVSAPRIHLEGGLLNLEPPCGAETLAGLARHHPRIKCWEAPNLFFGGVHSVARRANGRLEGAGDPRRGGVTRIALPGGG
jgi:gamma-glutamyltranspeptidase/glutathione hydrolase